jgi:hypothetical protein
MLSVQVPTITIAIIAQPSRPIKEGILIWMQFSRNPFTTVISQMTAIEPLEEKALN